jgi:hypothetical protein
MDMLRLIRSNSIINRNAIRLLLHLRERFVIYAMTKITVEHYHILIALEIMWFAFNAILRTNTKYSVLDNV